MCTVIIIRTTRKTRSMPSAHPDSFPTDITKPNVKDVYKRQLIKQAKVLPSELYKSLTWDRGKELTDHRRFTLATRCV